MITSEGNKKRKKKRQKKKTKRAENKKKKKEKDRDIESIWRIHNVSLKMCRMKNVYSRTTKFPYTRWWSINYYSSPFDKFIMQRWLLIFLIVRRYKMTLESCRFATRSTERLRLYPSIVYKSMDNSFFVFHVKVFHVRTKWKINVNETLTVNRTIYHGQYYRICTSKTKKKKE